MSDEKKKLQDKCVKHNRILTFFGDDKLQIPQTMLDAAEPIWPWIAASGGMNDFYYCPC